ncbi:Methylmalonate-semialdehyde dehydrogenase [acylating], mitochondrial [Oryzias melastigma]|uniref:Methylmalonate-semialdehyde dehydrogenase [acylating], mitochondrial n=1 Tax=Oryzias melastigma TaxID=30732 RepID=A0A834BYQ7_ORYME|nr:Methylmalonate-semialdehyde dehydrogenase [acylating], mitochondrial [Oryzias melastigma]
MCYSSSSVPTVKLFIDGKFVESKTSEWLDIHNPATNEVIARVPKATQEEMLAAADSCSRSFHSWSETSALTRQQVFLRYQQLIKDNIKELAKAITVEQGKTLADAEGDVFRGLQVVEHACSITSLMLGETLPSITKDMDTYTYRLPLGVCAGIAPFNFPAMIPLWMFPYGHGVWQHIPAEAFGAGAHLHHAPSKDAAGCWRSRRDAEHHPWAA